MDTLPHDSSTEDEVNAELKKIITYTEKVYARLGDDDQSGSQIPELSKDRLLVYDKVVNQLYERLAVS